MDYVDIELILYEIITSVYYFEYNNKEYQIVPNTSNEKRRAGVLYKKILDDIKYDGIPSWSYLQIMSKNLNIWTDKDQTTLDGMEKMLENLKLELYKSYLRPDKVKEIKKQINKIKNSMTIFNDTKYKLYYMSKEYYAENIKKDFLYAMSIRDLSGKRIYNLNEFDKIDPLFINKAKECGSDIDTTTMRKIARSEPWRSMWIAQKGQALGTPSIEWTDLQRILVSYSKMYDNVYESSDCPPDAVIDDDDMLDGWFIEQKKEREKQRNQKLGDKMFKNNKDGQELFLVANSQEEAQHIYNMNDERSKNIVRTRQNVIKNQGKVDHGYLPDVQNDLRMQATQQFSQSIRKR